MTLKINVTLLSRRQVTAMVWKPLGVGLAEAVVGANLGGSCKYYRDTLDD